MSKRLTAEQTARLLMEQDRILILTHQFPDGDTLGSGFALCQALQSLGKAARVACSDPYPEKYAYMIEGIPQPEFTPAFICAVDVADPKLLGELQLPYEGRIDLCIDHHTSNREYAAYLLLDGDCAATALLITDVIAALGVELTRPLATCLYTAVATDTGCFKYGNTSARAHRLAAAYMDCGIDFDRINREMFDIKSRARVELERMALETMTFYYEGRCAVMIITGDMIARSQAGENDMEGLAPMPRQIEGVWVGVTMRQRADGRYKVSVRTGTHADASAICTLLGGGGHVRAAGCTLEGTAEEAIPAILAAVQQAVPAITDHRAPHR